MPVFRKKLQKKVDKFIIGQHSSNTNAANLSTNSVWTWLGGAFDSIVSAIVDVINYVGYFLGIPGDYSYTINENPVIRNWCGFLGGDWCGGGGGGTGGGGNGSISNLNFVAALYADYVNGYNGYNGDGWNPYSSGDPCGGSQNVASSKLTTQQVPGGSGPCDPSIPPQQQPGLTLPPVLSAAQFKTRAIVDDILSNIEIDYQVSFGLSNSQRLALADFIYSNNLTEINQNAYQLDSYSPDSYDEDPPLLAKLKAYLRKIVGIDNPPETPEETAERINEMNRLGALGDYVKQLHEAYKNVYGIVPGYLALDGFMTGDLAGGSANLAFDVFGGELARFATSAVIRPGAKYAIRVTELFAKNPDIARYLKSIRVPELVIIKGTAPNKIIVIGESMDRVIPTQSTFDKIFNSNIVETFEPTNAAKAAIAGKTLTDAELKGTQMYLENSNWIQEKISQGYTIIDIGYDRLRTNNRSPFYSLERSFIYK